MRVVHTVLFVCEANICRSALMEAVFRDATPSKQWSVSSAGTKVPAGALKMCAISAEIAGATPDSHHPTGVDADTLRTRELVVTASRAERAAVGAIVPQLRWKIFTLREILLLGTTPPTRVERREATLAGRGAGVLSEYAEVLHRRRGLFDLPPQRRTFFTTSRAHPLDIRDVHGERQTRHRTVLLETAADTRVLAERLLAVAGAGA